MRAAVRAVGGAAQNAPDGGGDDPMAKPSQLALDSDVPP
jgi:hypothetical protein